MRRAPAWIDVVVVVGVMTTFSNRATAEGFWVTLAAGVAGSATSSDYSEFWFESPHGPPLAVTQLNGSFNAQAITSGGSTFFNNVGTPVLLPTNDGFALLTNREVANGSRGLPRFDDVPSASGAPLIGQPVPGNSNQVQVGLTDPTDEGRVLTVDVTDPDGVSLGKGSVLVQNGDWWVIGLGPGVGPGDTVPDPDPIGGGGADGSGEEPKPDPGTGPSGPGGPPSDPRDTLPPEKTPATPEPGTLVLVGIGGLGLGGWRRLRRSTCA